MRFWLALILSACGAAAWADTMVEVSFMDQPPDSGGYVTRMLVTDRYLRMDFGQDGDDFVLFDRKAQRVYNVTHDQRQILLIEPGTVSVPKPEKWEVSENVLTEDRGKRTYDLEVNGIRCSRITAADMLLPDVTQALGDFYELLSATQAATYLATPVEMRNPCELARHILEPRRWLKYGFPLYEADGDGSVRRLLGYQTGVQERPKLFALPASYRTISMRDMQGLAGKQK